MMRSTKLSVDALSVEAGVAILWDADLKGFGVKASKPARSPTFFNTEWVNEDELAIFDLLTRPSPTLTKAEEIEVKRVARELLERLKELVAAVDWRSGQQTRAAVESAIRFKLNELPNTPYPEALCEQKVAAVWEFVLSSYTSA